MSEVITNLFPNARGKILSVLFTGTTPRFHVRELARFLAIPLRSVQVELENLHRAGIVERSRDGNRLYYQAVATHPVFPELCGLFLKTTGVVKLLREVFEQMNSVQLAFIFGSMAAGTATSASDLDLLVIGTATLRQLAPKIRPISLEVHREINPQIMTWEEWKSKRASRDAFVLRVVKEPKLWLKGCEDDFGNMV
jgi:predicted nucleotidyltransferase